MQCDTTETNISTQQIKLCMMCNRQTGMAAGSVGYRYLVLLGDVLLVILLHLPELGLQATQLDLHLLHILQVPLGSLVQHLDGLGHVLDLKWQMDTLDWITTHIPNSSWLASVSRKHGKTQQTFNMLFWLGFLFAVIHKLWHRAS